MKQQCKCGNWCTGIPQRSLARRTVKTGIKTVVNGGMSVGAASTGAAIGTAILPGVGTLIGGAAGWLGSSLFHTKVNDVIDNVADGVVDEVSGVTYEFECPSCGRKWTVPDSDADSDFTDDHDYDDDIDDEDDIDDDVLDIHKYRIRREDCNLSHYCQNVVALNANCTNVANQVTHDTGINIYDWQIKDENGKANYSKLREILSLKQPADCNYNFWHNIVSKLPNDDSKENYIMEVYDSCCLSGWGNALLGVNISGSINVGDDVILCTFKEELYRAKVTWIEMYGEFCESSESGDTLGLGIDMDTIPDDVDRVFKYAECATQEDERQQNNNLLSEEQEYLEEYKEILAEGEIRERDRRMLERLAQRNGISASRAAELEASVCQSSLSEEEQEYLDEYREILAEGDILPRDRRILERLAQRNGISPSRAKEIERLA